MTYVYGLFTCLYETLTSLLQVTFPNDRLDEYKQQTREIKCIE